MGSRLREGTKQVFDCFLEIVPAREEVSPTVFSAPVNEPRPAV